MSLLALVRQFQFPSLLSIFVLGHDDFPEEKINGTFRQLIRRSEKFAATSTELVLGRIFCPTLTADYFQSHAAHTAKVIRLVGKNFAAVWAFHCFLLNRWFIELFILILFHYFVNRRNVAIVSK
jgi:hypothetical protein